MPLNHLKLITRGHQGPRPLPPPASKVRAQLEQLAKGILEAFKIRCCRIDENEIDQAVLRHPIQVTLHSTVVTAWSFKDLLSRDPPKFR